MTFDHRFYNDVRYSIMDEEKSLNNIKTRVEDDVSKAIWEEHGKPQKIGRNMHILIIFGIPQLYIRTTNHVLIL